MAKFIKLTQNKWTIVDDEDYDILIKYKWWARRGKTTFYAGAKIIGKDGKRHLVNMHTFIMGLFETKGQIDHWNHNGLDNRRKNLRVCSFSQNKQNNYKFKGNFTSKYKGVFYRKSRNRYVASISLNNVQLYLGYYVTEEEAAFVYNKAALELFGEFALLNKII